MNTTETPRSTAILLLIHLGASDGSLVPAEQEAIRQGLSSIFHDDKLEEEINALTTLWQRMGAASADEMLRRSLGNLAALTTKEKQQVFALLFDVINTDGRVAETETSLIRLVRPYLAN